MTQETNQIINYIPSIITSVSGFIGVVIGFILGFIGNFIRDKMLQQKTQAELMRGLLQEILTNHNKCNLISTNRTVSGYLETSCWDRIRYSDILYNCITSKNDGIYQQLLALYTGIAHINLGIARYLTALDSNTRVPSQTSDAVLNITMDNLRNAVIQFLPTLSATETNIRAFLIQERYFKA